MKYSSFKGYFIWDTWIFGIREKGTKRIVYHLVKQRNKDTLIPFKKIRFKKRCKIYSDCWETYSLLNEERFNHFRVNHVSAMCRL